MRSLLSVFLACVLLLVSATSQAESPIAAKLDNLLGNTGRDASAEDEFLDPDVAFVLSAPEVTNGYIHLRWDIEPGYYLYRDNFRFSVAAAEITLGTPQLAPGELKQDPAFGDVYVYHNTAEIHVPIIMTAGVETQTELAVTYQGCKEDTICYPPVTKRLPVALSVAGDSLQNKAHPGNSVNTDTVISSQDAISNSLRNSSVLVNIFVFLGFGLLLAFTPCVFPMIPILSGIIIGQGPGMTAYRAFLLSLIYVIAMALTYAVLGVIAGSFQFNLQAAAQNVWVISAFSLVFVLLALSMFGFYELQLPLSWQSYLNTFGNKHKQGSFGGAGIMGVLSAVIVGPCVAPPLAGALIYISQTGDAILGGTALFALGLGMGLPLLVIGTSAGKLLPRAGSWMVIIKMIFGVLMLGVAIWLMSRILPAAITLLLWGVLLIVTAIYMGALDQLDAQARWQKLWKGTGLALLVYGALLIVGAAAGSEDVFRPLQGIAGQKATTEKLRFTTIKSVTDVVRVLKVTDKNKQMVMLDFYADWCITCKEMEKYTFSKPDVHNALQNVVLLKADVTANDEIDQALLKHFGIIGPPAILFFVHGEEQRGYRLVGFVNAADFIRHIKQAQTL